MKVYVCTYESEFEPTREPVAVFSTLEMAQEKMRIEYDGYKTDHPNSKVKWMDGRFGCWGWFNDNVTDGFYVTEFELDNWEGK